MQSVLGPRVAGFLLAGVLALVAPAAAQAYTVTVHVHGAGTVTETTSAHLMNCTTPLAGISNASVTDCGAGSATGDYGQWWTVALHASVPTAYADQGWVFDHWVDGNAAGQIDCDDTPAHVGSRTSTDCQFAISSNVYVDLYFTDVAGPAGTTITGGPSGTTKATSATLTFSSFDPDASYDCKLDRPGIAGSYVACGGPTDHAEGYSGLTANGQYTFSVRSRDPSGNLGGTASRTWTVDTVAPVPALTGGPAEGSATSNRSATFSTTTNEGTLACTLDGAVLAPCPGSVSGLLDGPHTLTATATDAAGNSASVSRHWTVDTVAPTVSITGGPADGAITNATTASFPVTGNDADATWSCSLDGAARGCGAALTGLADGSHTFVARLTDLAGNAGSASRTWTVDTTPPDTAITGGPADGTASSTSLSFASEPGASFACSLDGAPFAPCTSPYSGDGLATGGHTFAVRAIDVAGNADASPATRSWTITAPVAPAGGGDAIAAPPLVPLGAGPTPGVAPGKVQSSWFVAGSRTLVKKLRATGVAKGSLVQVRCAGKGCPFKARTFAAKAGVADATAAFVKRKLAKGARVEVRISASGLLTRVFGYAVRAGKSPAASVGCLAAGAAKPGACPA